MKRGLILVSISVMLILSLSLVSAICGDGFCGESYLGFVTDTTNIDLNKIIDGVSYHVEYYDIDVIELPSIVDGITYNTTYYKIINGTKISVNRKISSWLLEGGSETVGNLSIYIVEIYHPRHPWQLEQGESPYIKLILGEDSNSCPEDCSNIICTDSDVSEEYPDGKNIFVKGTITREREHPDTCFGTTNRVNEYYCCEVDGKEHIYETYDYCVMTAHECPPNYFCEDGACISNNQTSHESDTNKNNIVEIEELMDYIHGWELGNVNIIDLMESVRLWKES